MARLSKSDESALEEFDLVFEEVPEVDNRRVSKWDPTWEAAVNLCRRHPGKSLKVRTYNNASTAYKEAKDINNGESRSVDLQEGEEASVWTAVSIKTADTYQDKNDKTQHVYAIYLTFNGTTESE